MNVEIVTTGTELLLGEIVDTNAAYIARQLREVGVNLFYKTTVGDNRARLAEVLRLGLSRSDAIIVSGGLGPTVDDITREAVADAAQRPLHLRPEIAAHLQEQFARWGRTLSQNNLRQAYLPQDAVMLANPIGTAPGFIVETAPRAGGCGAAIICLPGVPREMKRMMADHVLPYLQARVGGDAGVILTRVLHTAGIGESAIDELIGDLMTAGNPTVGLAAHMGRADVRL
ncbi:MAG: competence/damage-inducible protein A, partial [Caldilineales bacterium]|nr:competence/damage-inducible protein A [Caldilineales bacterium]